MARLRYERQQSDRALSAPPSQPERPSSAPESSRARTSVHAEPYMMSGYELLAQREYEQSNSSPLRETTRYNQSTDPAFRATGTWEKGVGDMENRYGRFMEMRDGGVGVSSAEAPTGMDEDMEYFNGS